MSIITLALGSDNLVRLDKLTDASSGDLVSAAVVVCTLYDSAGNAVAGASAIAMAAVAGTDGRYEGTLQDTLSLVDGRMYTLEITATSGTVVRKWRRPCRAMYGWDP